MAEVISTMVQVHVARCTLGQEPQHLILRRAASETVFPGLWQCVTGRIEANENAVVAALREVHEECGLHPLRFWTLPYVSQFYSLRRDAIVSIPVFAAVIRDSEQETLSHEHDLAEWCELTRATELLVIPAQREATRLFDSILRKEVENGQFHQVYEVSLPFSPPIG